MVITIGAFAQDLIVTKDAKKIDAKILEVSTSEIRYKELDNLDGPVFVLRVDEINCIIYANGKVVLYNKPVDEAAERAKQAEALAKANQFGSLFVNSGSSGDGPKGNPVGRGSKGGNNWTLAGRNIKGTLPQPSSDFRQEGTVIVQIRVNAAGKVVEAKVIGGDVADRYTLEVALNAAKKARFTEGDGEQIGTITYIFKLN